MPVFYIPEELRQITDGQADVSVPGHTVGEALTHLLKRYPSLQQHLYDRRGEFIKLPSPAINILLGSTDFRELQGVETPVADEDRLRICRTWAAATSGRRY